MTNTKPKLKAGGAVFSKRREREPNDPAPYPRRPCKHFLYFINGLVFVIYSVGVYKGVGRAELFYALFILCQASMGYSD
jgi:hypothetical protein